MHFVKAIFIAGLILVFAGEPAFGQKVRVNDKSVPYAVWHEKVMPGETMSLSLPQGYTAEIDNAAVSEAWTAPSKAGYHILTVRGPDNEVAKTLTIFVLEPYANIDAKGYLNGYRIGSYPRNPPKGFIKLDEGDRDLALSPHFKVGQFLCKQQPNHWPKYLTVTKSNLKRLETLLTSLNEDGETDAQTLFVMSGFRTPFYNTAIGSAKFSRHMYGDAADVYLDVRPRDGVMDDINNDGEITKADANYLYDYAQDLFAKSDDVEPGGLGSYKANAVHGPFVHVDGRGKRARWGR